MAQLAEEKRQAGASQFAGLRVCMVAPYLPKKGGVTIQTHLMVDSLEREGAEVMRVDTYIHSIGHKMLLPLRIILQAIFTAIRFMRVAPKCDIVHIQACSWWGFLPVMVVAPLNKWFFKKRLVISFHGGRGHVWLKRHNRLAKRYMRMADQLVVVSPRLKKAFAEYDIDSEVLWNLVDIDRFQYRERTNIKSDIVWIRTFSGVYDPLTAIKVFAKVKKEVPEATITFIGDGPLKPQMDSLIQQLGLSDVNYTGRLPNSEVPAIYDRTDIFLNTSRNDGLPTALLEASAAGFPIVTTAAGGIPDMMENGKEGVIVDAGDVDALAREVVSLIRDPKRAHALSVAARKNAEKYSWQRCAKDLSVYYQLDQRNA